MQSKNFILFSIILLLESSLFRFCFAQPQNNSNNEKVFCDFKNRPQNDQCFDSGSDNVCSFYTEDCPLDICGRSSTNFCYSCAEPTTIYYKERPCTIEEQIFSCKDSFCDIFSFPEDFQNYMPVCGIRKNCIKGDCTQVFDNSCAACTNANIGWYTSGVCPKDRRTCSKTNYHSKSTSVCAFFTDNSNELQHTTANNAKTVCSDPGVLFYTNGKCKRLERDKSNYCLPNIRPKSCSDEYEPVCGFFKTEINGNYHGIMTNACTACRDPNVIYYDPGPCIFKCERNENIAVDCDGSNVSPVCGSYTDSSGKIHRFSIKNECVACFDFRPYIDTYTDGLCPGDKGISCINEPLSFGYGDISPVCGLSTEECIDSSCRKTYAEPIAACEAPAEVILYKPGFCPGDQGISCDPYRPDIEASLCGSDIRYSQVCGYSSLDCNDGSCRTTFSDQCNACADATILFFKEDPCLD